MIDRFEVAWANCLLHFLDFFFHAVHHFFDFYFFRQLGFGPMPAERVYAHPDVRYDVAHTALRRGPIIYCLEQADHAVPLQRVLLSSQAKLTPKFDPGRLAGALVLEGHGVALSDSGWDEALYRNTPPETEACAIYAIPYYAWDNREAGSMTVWLRDQPVAANASAT